jgi:hypothetical protein
MGGSPQDQTSGNRPETSMDKSQTIFEEINPISPQDKSDGFKLTEQQYYGSGDMDRSQNFDIKSASGAMQAGTRQHRGPAQNSAYQTQGRDLSIQDQAHASNALSQSHSARDFQHSGRLEMGIANPGSSLTKTPIVSGLHMNKQRRFNRTGTTISNPSHSKGLKTSVKQGHP